MENDFVKNKRNGSLLLLTLLIFSFSASSANLNPNADGTSKLNDGSEITIEYTRIDPNGYNKMFAFHENLGQIMLFRQDGGILLASHSHNLYTFDLSSTDILSQPYGKTYYDLLKYDQMEIYPNGATVFYGNIGARTLQPFRTNIGICNLEINLPQITDAFAFSKNGKYLVYSNASNIHVYDLCRNQNIAVLQGHSDAIVDLEVSSNNEYLVSSSRDKKIILWDLDTFSEKHLITDNSTIETKIKFSPNSNLIGYSPSPNIIELFDIQSESILKSFSAIARYQFQPFAFSPDPERIAFSNFIFTNTSYFLQIQIWDIESDNFLTMLNSSNSGSITPRSMAFSPDGSILAVGYANDQVELWNLQQTSSPDADFDSIPDSWENTFNLNVNNFWDKFEDPDLDGLNNYMEYLIGSNPTKLDTDDDGIPDYNEFVWGFNLTLNDAASDYDEDGIPNLWEYENELLPLWRDSIDDNDGDGLPNLWEFKYNLSASSDDSQLDLDADGLSNIEEYLSGTSPILKDTDFDGISDAEEIELGYNPFIKNSKFPEKDENDDGVLNILFIMSNLLILSLTVILISRIKKFRKAP